MISLLSFDRESVVLKNLTECSVYLLDYSGEVEVSNVVNSQIFIGASYHRCHGNDKVIFSRNQTSLWQTAMTFWGLQVCNLGPLTPASMHRPCRWSGHL